MDRVGRNTPCPCGSGKKYKVCCARATVDSDPTEHPLLKEAIACFRYGFFEGAVQRCERLERISFQHEAAAAGVSWYSRVYSGRKDFLAVARRSPHVSQVVTRAGAGGPGAAEIAWLFYDCWDGQQWNFPNGKTLKQKSPYQQVLSFIDNQNGVLVSFHPAAVLRLAELAAESNEDRTALSLVNCALCWRSPYAVGDDLERLAKLMALLDAPAFLWADWAAFYIQHVKLMHSLATHASEIVPHEDFSAWARSQNIQSEEVLSRVFEIAPHELPAVMTAMNPYFGAQALDKAIEKVAMKGAVQKNRVTIRSDLRPTAFWYGHPDIRTRYFWFDMLQDHEKNFVTNGDWALGCTPTEDFSMGLAQWWRLIESVFGRIVNEPLGKLLDENPQWLEHDLQNLSKSRAEREAVFLKKLAPPEKRGQITLVDILRILHKCVLKPEAPSDSGSLVRQKATEFLEPHAKLLTKAVQADGAQPFLTDESVNEFRNRASHSSPIKQADAFAGRLVAKRVIELLFLPTLETWGFKPSIPVFTV